MYIKVERNIMNPLLPVSSLPYYVISLPPMVPGGLEVGLACITSISDCSRRLLQTVKQE